MTIIVEAAVESLDDAMAAVEGGADRLELCANLLVGGTTPDEELIATVVSCVDVPVFAMIRPRGGSFIYSERELDRMRRDVDMTLRAGATGLVLGVLDAAHRVDAERTRAFASLAGDAPVTFHRAFDRTPDLFDAAEALIAAGVVRVLTSGGAATASEGADVLAALVERVGSRLVILAGGGVRAANAGDVVRRTAVREVHARCEGDASRIRAIKRAIKRAVEA